METDLQIILKKEMHMGKIDIYITRHGETLYNIMNCIQGWVDTPLTDLGIDLATRLGVGLKNIEFENIFTSDMHRAVHTAELILSKNLYMKKTKIMQDQRIREWCFGSMEGKSNSQLLCEIKKTIGDVSFEQINHYLPQVAEYIVKHDTTGWAETFSVIQKRLNSFLDDIVNNYSGGNFLVVTHAFLIRTIIYLYGYEKLDKVSKIENASITKMEYINGRFNITEINNTDYIK